MSFDAFVSARTKGVYIESYTNESFHIKRPFLVEVRSWTDPDLPSMVIFYVRRTWLVEINRLWPKILDHEANWRRCLHGFLTVSDGMTQSEMKNDECGVHIVEL